MPVGIEKNTSENKPAMRKPSSLSELAIAALLMILHSPAARAQDPVDYQSCIEQHNICVDERTRAGSDLEVCRSELLLATTLNSKYTSLEEQLNASESSLTTCEDKLAATTTLTTKQKEELAATQEELAAARDQNTSLIGAVTATKAAQAELTAKVNQIEEQRSSLTQANSRLEKIKRNLTSKSSQCNEALDELTGFIDENEAKIVSLTDQHASTLSQLSEKDQELKAQGTHIAAAKETVKALEEQSRTELEKAVQAGRTLQQRIYTGLVTMAILVLIALLIWGGIQFRKIYLVTRFDIHRARYLNPYYEIARRQVARYESFASIAPILLILFTISTLGFLVFVGETILASPIGWRDISSAAWPALVGLFTPIGGLIAIYHNMEKRLRDSIKFVRELQQGESSRRVPRDEASLVLLLEVCVLYILRKADNVKNVADDWIKRAESVTNHDAAIALMRSIVEEADVPAPKQANAADLSTVMVFLRDLSPDHEEQWRSVRHWVVEVFEATAFMFRGKEPAFRKELEDLSSLRGDAPSIKSDSPKTVSRQAGPSSKSKEESEETAGD